MLEATRCKPVALKSIPGKGATHPRVSSSASGGRCQGMRWHTSFKIARNSWKSWFHCSASDFVANLSDISRNSLFCLCFTFTMQPDLTALSQYTFAILDNSTWPFSALPSVYAFSSTQYASFPFFHIFSSISNLLVLSPAAASPVVISLLAAGTQAKYRSWGLLMAPRPCMGYFLTTPASPWAISWTCRKTTSAAISSQSKTSFEEWR
mmetsp:Transcript_102163/g.288570  ORF Transcript_102163/g.288570 Transcript_102163/m.288570 type:complete len:208 (+) Transcript_102163:36-659(+)